MLGVFIDGRNMENLNRKELTAYRKLAEHVGIHLAKNWMELSKKDQSEMAQIVSNTRSNNETKPNSKVARKGKGPM